VDAFGETTNKNTKKKRCGFWRVELHLHYSCLLVLHPQLQFLLPTLSAPLRMPSVCCRHRQRLPHAHKQTTKSPVKICACYWSGGRCSFFLSLTPPNHLPYEVMRGRGHKRVAERAFKQWRKLHFNTLCDSRRMPTPLHATLRLPLFIADAASPPPATVDVHLSTNHRTVAQWWQAEYGTFLAVQPDERETPKEKEKVEDDGNDGAEAGTAASPPVLAFTRVAAHVGPPGAPLGYPEYIALEAKQWTEGVLRGEAYACEHADSLNGVAVVPPVPPQGARYLAPIRWIQQPLLDGFVAQRLTAHAGVTTTALLDARRAATALGRQLPPYELSPFYAANELLDRWCIFGEPSVLLPPATHGASSALSPPLPTVAGAQDAAAAPHRRAAELALAAAVLPNYHAAWLNGAVVANSRTGRCVLIVGRRSSGKTTLALHCVAPTAATGEEGHPETDQTAMQLTAAEHFFIGAGTPVRRMLLHTSPPHRAPSSADALPHAFVCALPQRVRVGIGAVLGSLRPNPALAAAVQLPPFLCTEAGLRAFLANSDAVIWDMSMHYHVPLQSITAPTAAAWQPAAINGLAGVVLLDWDVNELASTAATASTHTCVHRIPLHAGGLTELLARGRDYLFRGHYLIRSVYDEATEGPARLSRLFEEEWAANPPAVAAAAAPSLHCVEGSVDFEAATQLIKRLLCA
jgi:hypothetical protein